MQSGFRNFESADVVDDKPFNLLGLCLPRKATLVTVLTTLLLTYDWYYDAFNGFIEHYSRAEYLRNVALDRLGLYFVIPMAVIVLVFRESPSKYGFSLGDWRAGLKWTVIAWAAATPVLYIAARTPAMVDYYTSYNVPAAYLVGSTALDLFSWEFFFRGFILFALYRAVGPSAIMLQAVPFALAHLSKPPLETFSTIFGGIAFGWVAWRTHSFVYSFLIHLYVTVFVILISNLR